MPSIVPTIIMTTARGSMVDSLVVSSMPVCPLVMATRSFSKYGELQNAPLGSFIVYEHVQPLEENTFGCGVVSDLVTLHGLKGCALDRHACWVIEDHHDSNVHGAWVAR